MSFVRIHLTCAVVILVAATWQGGTPAGGQEPLAAALTKIRAVQPAGEGHRQAVAAAKVAAGAEASQLVSILQAMDGAGPLAENWLRGAAEAVAQRATSGSSGKLPVAELEAFLADTRHSPRGRRLAYELVAAADSTAESRLIPTLLDDPSLELRRDAVAQLLATAAKSTDKAASAAEFSQAFRHARDLDQIKSAAAKLKEFGQPPDIASHMGFVMNWKIVGPFDNTDDRGWDATYPPEATVDLSAEYEGQKGKIRWIDFATKDGYGLVDLTKALDKHKGAVAYAYAEFLADRRQSCDLRLCCINANKVWLNGELLTANHVYHANDVIDQYAGRGTLKPGQNAILIKVCQNEQTEDWAQRWEFKLRVCDSIGTAILAQDRPAAAAAKCGGGGEGESGRD